jgi:probable F420-dependent oxidoreductase
MKSEVKLGVVFPQNEIGAARQGVRDYALAAEELGYQHVLAYDHVLGADPAVHHDWSGPYDIESTFHEVFVLFGHLAALTSLELVCGILILPQRQTALVAKQAAEVDLLTGGHFRLGVGVGWNAVEYEALGEDFENRGARVGEQIELLRKLWTEPSVTFSGKYHKLTGAGIAPLPLQQPIPIWLGADGPPGFRRVGRFADGWFPQVDPGPRLEQIRTVISEAAVAAGRDPQGIAMEGRVRYGNGDLEAIAVAASAWRQAGATHISLNTMRCGLSGPGAHIAALARAKEALSAGDADS